MRPETASEPELVELLAKLQQMALEQHSRGVYFQRNVQVYERDAIHLMKPAERRFWTKTAAYNDADGTIAQLLRAVPNDGNERAARSA